MKRTLSFLIILSVILSVFAISANSEELKFTDVPQNAWYYGDVKNAVSMGLINGKSETTFAPDDNLTYAEAFKLAACMHQLATQGTVTLKNGEEYWFSTYVEYCFMNGIYNVYDRNLFDEDFDPNAKITRSGYMSLFANALPEDMLPVINYVPDGSIPDVTMSADYTEGVYKLYRAGILQGSDELHSCKPFDNIKRSEVAAILTRMMDKTKRVRFDMGTPVEYAPLAFSEQPKVIIPESGGKISFSVKMTGGVEPYKYSWMYQYDGVWIDIGKMAAVDDELIDAMTGFNTDTFTLLVDPSAANERIILKCVVSDALGNKLTSEPITFTSQEGEDGEKAEENPKEDKGAQYYLDNRDESRGQNPQSPIKVTVSGTQFGYFKGGYVSVKVEATGGTQPYHTYSWYREVDGKWVFLTGGSHHPTNGYDPTFVMYEDYIKNPGETFKIKCVVKDSEGYTGESDVVTITTSDFALEKSLPEKTEVAAGDDLELSVKAKGGKEPYTYEWYLGEFIIPTKSYSMLPLSAEGDTLSIKVNSKHLPKSDNMITSFVCVIVDAEGSKVQTSTEIVDITPESKELYIAVQPYRVSKPTYSGTVKFDIEVYGGKELYTYEWFYDTRGKGGTTTTSLSTYPQTQVRRSESEIDITVREDNPLLDKEIYCVVTDANGNKVTSEKVAVCPDYLIIKLEDKIDGAYVGTLSCGELVVGDKIAFYGRFNGEYEYTEGTVESISMFGKNLDKAVGGDRVGIVLKNVKKHENNEDLKPLIGYPANMNQNLALEVLPQALNITVKNDNCTTVSGSYTHVNIYVSGGKEPYKSIQLYKLVDGEWIYFDKYLGTPKNGLNQYIYHGAKEPEQLKVKCVITDADGKTAESNLITLTTSSLAFESKLPKVTYSKKNESVTFTVKVSGGEAPYTYTWRLREVRESDGMIVIRDFKNGVDCSGQGTDTFTVTDISDYVSTTGNTAVKREIGCVVTDSSGVNIGTYSEIINN